jgi:hypothetical protein
VDEDEGVDAVSDKRRPRVEPEEEELVGYLERDQLEAEMDLHLPRAPLRRRARAGLWALRVFVLVLAFMVIYTFVAQLH